MMFSISSTSTIILLALLFKFSKCSPVIGGPDSHEPIPRGPNRDDFNVPYYTTQSFFKSKIQNIFNYLFNKPDSVHQDGYTNIHVMGQNRNRKQNYEYDDNIRRQEEAREQRRKQEHREHERREYERSENERKEQERKEKEDRERHEKPMEGKDGSDGDGFVDQLQKQSKQKDRLHFYSNEQTNKEEQKQRKQDDREQRYHRNEERRDYYERERTEETNKVKNMFVDMFKSFPIMSQFSSNNVLDKLKQGGVIVLDKLGQGLVHSAKFIGNKLKDGLQKSIKHIGKKVNIPILSNVIREQEAEEQREYERQNKRYKPTSRERDY